MYSLSNSIFETKIEHQDHLDKSLGELIKSVIGEMCKYLKLPSLFIA